MSLAQVDLTLPAAEPQSPKRGLMPALQVFTYREHRYWFDARVDGYRVWRGDVDYTLDTPFATVGGLKQRLDTSLIADTVISLRQAGEDLPHGETIVVSHYKAAAALRDELWTRHGIGECVLLDTGCGPCAVLFDPSSIPAVERCPLRQMAWAGYADGSDLVEMAA